MNIDDWRGDDEAHESGDRCIHCGNRVATERGYPYCTICLLEQQLEMCGDVNDDLFNHIHELEETLTACEELLHIREAELEAKTNILHTAQGFRALVTLGQDDHFTTALHVTEEEAREAANDWLENYKKGESQCGR